MALPDYFDLGKYNIAPADVVRMCLECDPDEIARRVVVTPVWHRALAANHRGDIRDVSPRAFELDVGGAAVTIIRSDIGAPVTGDIVLALGATRCRHLIFTGSVGGLDPRIQIGDLMLARESVTGDGFSRYLQQESFEEDRFLERVQPDETLTRRLGESAASVCGRDSIALHPGVVFSTDSIVAQFSRIDFIHKELGCIGIEMETAATFHAAKLVGIEAAALLIVSDVIPAGKSLFSGRTDADHERRRAVKRNQLPEAILHALAATPS